MNNKGLSMIELVVSFMLVAFIVMALFRAVIKINEVLASKQQGYEITMLMGTLNNAIQQDLLNQLDNPLKPVIKGCEGECYRITFDDEHYRQIKIDRDLRMIQYGEIIEKLPDNFVFGVEGITLSFNQYDEDGGDGVYNSLFQLKVPIVHEQTKEVYGVDVVYAYQDKNL